MELFRSDIIAKEILPELSYISQTEPGIARGQHEYKDQADLFCFVDSSGLRLYLRDARKDSPTFDAGEQNPLRVIVPACVVFAYRNVGSIRGE